MPETSKPNPEVFSREEARRLTEFKDSLVNFTPERMGSYPLNTLLDVPLTPIKHSCCYCDKPGTTLCERCFELVHAAKAPNLVRAVQNLLRCPCNFCGRHVTDGVELCARCQQLFVV